MSIFHVYNDNTFHRSRVNVSNIIKEDIRNVNWFNVSTRIYDPENNIYYVSLKEGTKVFDGCNGNEYFTQNSLYFCQIECALGECSTKSISHGVKTTYDKEKLIEMCTKITKKIPFLHGLYFMHVCKSTGFCLSSFVMCQGTVKDKLSSAVIYTDKTNICEDDYILLSLLHKKYSIIDIIEMLEENTPSVIIRQIKNNYTG